MSPQGRSTLFPDLAAGSLTTWDRGGDRSVNADDRSWLVFFEDRRFKMRFQTISIDRGAFLFDRRSKMRFQTFWIDRGGFLFDRVEEIRDFFDRE